MSRENFACPKCGASGVFEVLAVEQDEHGNDVPVSTALCPECNVVMERAREWLAKYRAGRLMEN